MSQQIVYFNNPSDITALQTQVNQSFMTTTYPATQKVEYSGNDLNNSGFMPKNNEYLDKYGISSYEVGFVNPIPSGLPAGIGKTLNGVCDLDYIYYAWEAQHGYDSISQGQSLSGLQFPFVPFGPNSWVNGAGAPTYLVKVDRKTNKIVQYKDLGDITGLHTTNWSDYNQAGDDVTRGPLCLYGDYIYLTGQSQKYHTIMKIKKSDLTLVWRKEVWNDTQSIGYTLTGSIDTNLSIGPAKMRNIIVIPPAGGRTKPLVVSVATSTEYGTVVTNSLSKFFEYYSAYGHVFAYEDNGSDATKLWQFDTVPDFLQAGDALPTGSFNLKADDSIQDELRIYDKLVNGYVFQAGSTGGTGVAKTDGVFYMLTYPDLSLYNPTLNPPFCYYMKVDFTENSANWNHCAGVFDSTKSYTGVFCNMYSGQEVSSKSGAVRAADCMSFIVADGSGLKTTITGTSIAGNPVTKIFYKQQIGHKILSSIEAHQLNYYGAGMYANITYDAVQDAVILGANNFSQGVLDDEWRTYNWLRKVSPNTSLNQFTTPASIQVPNCLGWEALSIERGLHGIAGASTNPAYYPSCFGNAASGAFMTKDVNNVMVDSFDHQINRLNYLARLQTLTSDLDKVCSGEADFKYGPRASRALNGVIFALGCNNGALKFAAKTWISDQTEHSTSFRFNQSNGTVYRTNGANQDYVPGFTISKVNYGAAAGGFTGPRYLLAANKSRFQIMDLDAAYASGTSLTGTNGLVANQYSKGITGGIIGMNNPIFVYKDMQRALSVQGNFNSIAYNAETNTFVTRAHGIQDGRWQMFGPAGVSTGTTSFEFKNYHNNLTVTDANFGGELIVGEAGLAAHPHGFGNTLFFYDIKSIVQNPNTSSKWNNWAWDFENHIFGELGLIDGGDVQQCGDLTVAGTKKGDLNFIDTAAKRLKHTIYINGGASITPLMVDGVMYGYGGNSKWNWSFTPQGLGNATENTYRKDAKELFMITPYGK
jgi:hypothetical protein